MRIHSKVLNIWFKQAGAKFGIDANLYAGTKHTTATGLRKEFDCFCRIKMEAASRFELENGGFADLCLTTWLCRPLIKIDEL